MLNNTLLMRVLTAQQRTPQWYHHRKNNVTASEIPNLVGSRTAHLSESERIVRLIRNKASDQDRLADNLAVQHGVDKEDRARAYFEELAMPRNGIDVIEVGLVRHPTEVGIAASPDGIILDKNGTPVAVLEIKCPYNRSLSDKVSEDYLLQIQHQLEVCDLNVGHLFEARISESDQLLEWRSTKIYRDTASYRASTLPVVRRAVAVLLDTSSAPSHEPPPMTTTLSWSWVDRALGYLCDDPVVDWLNMYGATNGFLPASSRSAISRVLSERKTLLTRSYGVSASLGSAVWAQGGPVAKHPRPVDLESDPLPYIVQNRTLKPLDFVDTTTGCLKLSKKWLVSAARLLEITVKKERYGAVLGKNTVGWLDLWAYQDTWGGILAEAKEWCTELTNEGASMNPYRHAKLSPNMNAPSDRWGDSKHKLAVSRGEPSLLWNVSAPKKGRKRMSIFDAGATAEIYRAPKRARPNIDSMLEQIRYPRSSSPRLNVLDGRDFVCVDIEFLPGIVGNRGVMYMIGAWDPVDQQWRSWVANMVSEAEEQRIALAFGQWLVARGNPVLLHWSKADPHWVEKIWSRASVGRVADVVWFDLMQYMIDERVTLPGLYDYKLKNVTAVLHNLGMCRFSYTDDSDMCESAMESMVLAWKHYGMLYQDVNYTYDVMRVLKKYNRLDCAVIEDVLRWLGGDRLERVVPETAQTTV